MRAKRQESEDRRRRRAAGKQIIDLSGMPPAQRIGVLLGVLSNLSPRLAADPAEERARLEAVPADRVALAIPRDEYEAMRRNSLRLLGDVR
jgi:hypothetical protein